MLVQRPRQHGHERDEEAEAALASLGGLVSHLLVECLDDGRDLDTEEREGTEGGGGGE